VVVAIVSTCVFIYAKDYMATDVKRRSFLVHLLFFTAFMNIFIVSDDFVTLFIG
jgi:NADH:ubiquinone oxidoreductase subunit 5 (subunit L)/multisubunit Na+/H+ antiporter MnhA subunit